MIGLLVAWLWMTQTAWYAAGLWPQSSALRLNMFAVGDGSCFLLRSGREAMLFDCGSQHFLDIGEASIAPALQALGVRELKWIVISHADFDHFCGVLDVVDRVGVGGVLVPPDLIAEAIQRPHGTAAFLLDGLRVAGVPVQAITAGWVATLGEARLQTLWPPETFASRRTNDRSLVLSVEAAGRRAVLNGDVQNAAIESMLASGMSLRADVVELAHHGSYVDASRRWLAAVSPEIALQSCGRSRLQHDPWRDALAEIGAVRYVTAEVGMVEVVVGRDGTLRASSFRQPERD